MTRAHLLSSILPFALITGPASAEPPAPDADQIERLLEMSDRLRDLAEAMGADESAEPRNRIDGRTRKLIENPDKLREAAREMERALEDADVLESLAEMAITLSEQVEIVEGEDSLSLSLSGREMLSVEGKDNDDRITVRAGGRKITIEVD